MKVYIAGPYSSDHATGVRNALRLADYLTTAGCHVKVPHLTHFWDMMFPRPYEFWLAYDMVELKECDVLVRMAGESHGADAEVLEAIKSGMTVHVFGGFNIQDLNALDNFIHEQKKRYDK